MEEPVISTPTLNEPAPLTSPPRGFLSGLKAKVLLGAVAVVVLVGVLAGVYFLRQPQPQPAPSKPPEVPVVLTPEAGFSLEASSSAFLVGGEVRVSVLATSEGDTANLFVAKLKFPSDLLEATKIDLKPKGGTSFVANWFVANWVENVFDNQAGTVSLVGGVPNPGFKSDKGIWIPMADVVFKAKKAGKVEISFDEASAVYRNVDNNNIINAKKGVSFEVYEGAADFTPSPAPEREGDINQDGKVDLVDLSALLSKWGELGTDAGKADLNDDGVVNSFDYGQLIKILLNLQVIKNPGEASPESTPSGQS